MKSTRNTLFILFVLAVLFASCDEHKPPNVSFKTGGSYTSGNATVAKGASVTVGIIADKTEDELKTYNISYAFDGASSTTTKETFTLSDSEASHYEKDYTFTARNQAGSEKWYFTITDRDGNIAKLELTLTVN